MDSQDAYLIAYVMEQLGYATIIQQQQQQQQHHYENHKLIIILWGDTNKSHNHKEHHRNILQQEVIAKLQLQKVQQSLEQQIQLWTTKAQKAYKSALQIKQQQQQQQLPKSSPPAAVLHYLKIHKLYAQKVQTSQDQLVSIEQALQTLEQARTQHDIVNAMKSTTLALEGLRTVGPSSREMDDLMEEYQEEVDNVRQVQDTLASSSTVVVGSSDDKEEDELLLAELEQLMINDDDDNDDIAKNTKQDPPLMEQLPLSQILVSNHRQGEEDAKRTTTTTNTDIVTELPKGKITQCQPPSSKDATSKERVQKVSRKKVAIPS